MGFDLQSILPQLLAPAIAWAEMQSRQAEQEGQNLNPEGLEMAKRAGVRRPELIRVKTVDQLPLPAEPLLRQAAVETGLLGPGMVGLTLGYCIFVVRGRCRTNAAMSINMRPAARLLRSCLSIWSKSQRSVITILRWSRMRGFMKWAASSTLPISACPNRLHLIDWRERINTQYDTICFTRPEEASSRECSVSRTYLRRPLATLD